MPNAHDDPMVKELWNAHELLRDTMDYIDNIKIKRDLSLVSKTLYKAYTQQTAYVQYNKKIRTETEPEELIDNDQD